MRRIWAWLSVLLVVTGMAACSKTEPTTELDGDLQVRSGLTTVGWIAMIAAVVFCTLFVGFVITMLAVTSGGEIADRIRSRQWRQAWGWLSLLLFGLSIAGLMGWGIYANTVFKFQTSVVTASRTTGELTVERHRMLGGDIVRAWRYTDIVRLEFHYIPSRPGENPIPPMGEVYVVATNGTRSPVYDGGACVARRLADALTADGGIPLRVRTGGHDLGAGWSSLMTQLRCGVEEPFRPTSWRDYPAETWRVLDVPFLWRWRWAIPVAVAQLVLVGAAVFVVSRWRASALSTWIMASAVAAVGIAVAALHVFAVRAYGSWPIILAALALLSAQLVLKPLQKGRKKNEPTDESAA